jgi:hypothetical protein
MARYTILLPCMAISMSFYTVVNVNVASYLLHERIDAIHNVLGRQGRHVLSNIRIGQSLNPLSAIHTGLRWDAAG